MKFTPRNQFFIGFDSDGCVFDSMEIKHKECFIPALIWKWNLQSVSRLARECHEFVNLYSKWRGVNRFPGLLRTLELLGERPEAQARGFKTPNLFALRDWVSREKTLGNPALKRIVAETNSPLLVQTLDWSENVNARISELVSGVPPFPRVHEFLERAQLDCDMIVVSQTPGEALEREWREHNLDSFVQCICGQEQGSKDEHLTQTCAGRYPPERTLVVGDAYGDLKAAKLSKALFFPILPGREEESWGRLLNEGYARFLRGTFAGDYQDSLIAGMERTLPNAPHWKKT